MKHILFGLLLLVVGLVMVPQSAAAEKYLTRGGYNYEPLQVMDAPTAGMVDQDRLSLIIRNYQEGMIFKALLGIKHDFGAGFSVSVDSLVGDGKLTAHFGVQARMRLNDEDPERFDRPGIVLGLDLQGYGPYVEEYKRYKYKSKGIYLVASKNWSPSLGNTTLLNTGFHVGCNYSFEQTEDDDGGFSVFFGLDKVIAARRIKLDNGEKIPVPIAEVMAEWDMGLNDDKADGVFGEPEKQGYINLGLRWFLFPAWEENRPVSPFQIEFFVRNLMENNEDWSREFGLTFQTDLQFRIN